jgi:hypothetical protein
LELNRNLYKPKVKAFRFGGLFLYKKLMNKKVIHISLVAIFIVVTNACKSTKNSQILEEKTAFYSFQITKDTILNALKCELINVQIVDSKTRYTIDKEKEKNQNFLKIEVIDKAKKQMIAFCDHPLYKRFDLYSENGEIESKSVSLQKAELTIRIPYFKEYSVINITETVNFERKPIIVLKK